MKIFVVNAGSSSLKYQLIDMSSEKVLAKGLCERIGVTGCITHKAADGRVYKADTPMPTHSEAFGAVMYAMTESDAKVIDSYDEIAAVGHRVVQGGDIYDKSAVIDEKVMKDIEALSELAPLHNPANLLAIKACISLFGDKIPQVAVFDTSFHQTMEATQYIYPIAYEYYEKYKIRRYGAHGTSHRYVSDTLYEKFGIDRNNSKVITCHLGNGCSITAIKNGKCFDTSMGFTPLDGFMMGTRSGSLDPSVLTYIAKKEELSPDEISDLCNKRSGVLGVSGVSNDNRDVGAAAAEGNYRAALATNMQRYQILKFIGGYIAALGGVDAIVFTGGIGENDSELREFIMNSLSYAGIKCNTENNSKRGEDIKVSTDDSAVGVYVIPTNEELVIARDALALVK